MNERTVSLVGLSVMTLFWMMLIPAPSHAASTCTHYASPTGAGDGTSATQPFRIVRFWSVAKPGHTLCLLDGQYIGSGSMINPPQNLSGTAAAPITVRAVNDGKVTINGQNSSTPVKLYYNNYFVLEGFNARNSDYTVVLMSQSHHNIVRRVAAWDAADNNTEIFGAHHGTHNLFEDVAGWGVARKTFQFSQGGDYTTVRRAWGRWEGSHVTGPKMTYTLVYDNYSMICENCIGTWSGERMKQSYTLQNYSGVPHIRNGSEVSFNDYAVDHPYGIFSVDRLEADKNAKTKLLGSIAYIRSNDQFAPQNVVFLHGMDSVQVANTAVYIGPGSNSRIKPFGFYNLGGATAVNLVAENLTGIGGSGSSYGSDWKKSSIAEGSSSSSVPNIFTSSSSANLCHRYKDGVRSTEPLWPWPMNQRIIDAMVESGRTTVDVTKTIESMFGSIPSACLSGPQAAPGAQSAKSTPKPPMNLLVNRD